MVAHVLRVFETSANMKLDCAFRGRQLGSVNRAFLFFFIFSAL